MTITFFIQIVPKICDILLNRETINVRMSFIEKQLFIQCEQKEIIAYVERLIRQL